MVHQTSFLLSMLIEIRTQIYAYVLDRDTTFHIGDLEAATKPELHVFHWANRDLVSMFMDVSAGEAIEEQREAWLAAMIKDVETLDERENYDSQILRAISIPLSQSNGLALLQTCYSMHDEAAKLFYSRNEFISHSRSGNFNTASNFIEKMCPKTRRHIRSLGVLGLIPQSGFIGGSTPITSYKESERRCLNETIPYLSLISLTLGFHTDGLKRDAFRSDTTNVHFCPRSPWLVPFLRLHSLKSIDIRIFNVIAEEPRLDETHEKWLITQLNNIDRASRIKASFHHEDPPTYPKDAWQQMTKEEQENYEEIHGKRIRYNDIWNDEPLSDGSEST